VPPDTLTPTPTPVCSINISLFSAGAYKVAWEITNTGEAPLRMSQIRVDFPDRSSEYGNLQIVTFENPIWTGNSSSPANITNWQSDPTERDLAVSGSKLLALTFEKQGTGLKPDQLDVYFESPNGSCPAIHETWRP
jgi:hypothetical protein